MAQTAVRLIEPFRDKWFWAALVAALPVWGILITAWPPAQAHDATWANLQRLLLPVMIFPILEEIVFRGLLQGELLRTSWGRNTLAGNAISRANLLTSLLFSCTHLIAHSPAWSIAVFAPSLVFGWFRERHNGIRSPVILHCWYNFGYFLLVG